MFEQITIIITLIILLIGTITDIKKREVPDWISYGSIVAGLGTALIFTAITGSWHYISYSFIGGLIFTAIAFAMFYLGQWGGGDSKLLMGLGTLIGFNYSQIIAGKMPDLIEFLIIMAASGAVYGMLWSIYLVIFNSKNFMSKFKKISKKYINVKRAVLLLALVLIIVGIFSDFTIKIILLTIVIALVPGFYTWLYAKAIEKSSMQRYVNPNQLVEGDWLVKKIEVNGKVVADPKELGITKEQIEKLIKLKEKGKIDKILVKEGIPFIPSFLIAYVILLILNYYGINLLSLFI